MSLGGAPITVNSGASLATYNSIALTDSLTLNGGTILSAGATYTTTWSGPISLGASTNSYLNNAAVGAIVILSGKISGSGSLEKLNDGIFRLSNTGNNFSGGLTITSGKLQLGASGVIPDGAGVGDVTVNDTLDMNSYSETINGLNGTTGLITTGVAGSVTLTVGNNDATSSFGGIIQNGSGTVALTKTGAGTLTLSGTNTFTGAMSVNTGILQAGNTAALGAAANATTVSSGAAIDLNGNSPQQTSITINGAYDANNGAIICSSGWAAVNALVLGSNASIGCPTTRYDIHGAITGGGYTLTKVGSNFIAITVNASNIGSIIVNAGTLSQETATGFANAPVTVNSGASIASGWSKGYNFANALTMNGGTLLCANDTGFGAKWSGTVSLTGTGILNDQGYTSVDTLSGVISGAGSLLKQGAGIFVISNGSNSFSGGMNISAGTLKMGADKALSTGNDTITGTLDLHGCNQFINGLWGAGTIDDSAANTIVLSVGNNNASSTFSGVIKNTSGTIRLTKTGSGTVTFTGTNIYPGRDTISGGVLSAAVLALGGSNSSIGASQNGAGNLVLNGGTLQFSGTSSQRTDRNFALTSAGGGLDASGGAGDTIGISGADSIISGSPTLTLSGSNTSNNTISGVLNGALSIVKNGSGTWTLTGANTYTGTITVNAGTLNLMGKPTSNALTYVINGGTINDTDRLNFCPNPSSFNAAWMTLNGGTLRFIRNLRTELRIKPWIYFGSFRRND